MQRLVGGAALAALTAALGVPRDAAAAEQCGQEKDLIDEIAYLQTLQGEVADLLDAWYDKADADPKTDEYYLKALGAKEAEAKKREREYIYKLEDATEDLADCKLGPSEMQAKKKKEQLAAHFKKRSQEMDYKDKQAQTQYAAQLEKLKADEEKKKQYIDKNQASVQGDENQVEAMTQHVERRYKMLKSRYAEESETKATLRKRHEERHYKHTNSLKERLVDAGERTELFAEAYTLRQSEKAAKSLDQDLVYKLASESKAKAEESAMIQRKQEESAKEQKQKISYDK